MSCFENCGPGQHSILYNLFLQSGYGSKADHQMTFFLVKLPIIGMALHPPKLISTEVLLTSI